MILTTFCTVSIYAQWGTYIIDHHCKDVDIIENNGKNFVREKPVNGKIIYYRQYIFN